jgi:hypothetical protein
MTTLVIFVWVNEQNDVTCCDLGVLECETMNCAGPSCACLVSAGGAQVLSEQEIYFECIFAFLLDLQYLCLFSVIRSHL